MDHTRAHGSGGRIRSNETARIVESRADGTFDVLYNSYMLDLIPLAEMADVLRDFRRVLRPGGRLVLVNLSKREARIRSWAERIYELLPRSWVPYLMGSCRPVLMSGALAQAGFEVGPREFVPGPFPAEVVTAVKPSGAAAATAGRGAPTWTS